jgi:hypothetical protein
MVLKVSISLPGETVITFEASDPAIFRDVVGAALKELPLDLIRLRTDGSAWPASAQESKNVILESNAFAETSPSQSGTEESTDAGTGQEDSFVGFCQRLAPMGDMRRVVVAAEGARRYLDMESISEEELGHLFDLAGWRHPGDFLQTLRNASRSKFRWLERVPGSPGYYAVTEIGREKVIAPREK